MFDSPLDVLSPPLNCFVSFFLFFSYQQNNSRNTNIPVSSETMLLRSLHLLTLTTHLIGDAERYSLALANVTDAQQGMINCRTPYYTPTEFYQWIVAPITTTTTTTTHNDINKNDKNDTNDMNDTHDTHDMNNTNNTKNTQDTKYTHDLYGTETTQEKDMVETEAVPTTTTTTTCILKILLNTCEGEGDFEEEGASFQYYYREKSVEHEAIQWLLTSLCEQSPSVVGAAMSKNFTSENNNSDGTCTTPTENNQKEMAKREEERERKREKKRKANDDATQRQNESLLQMQRQQQAFMNDMMMDLSSSSNSESDSNSESSENETMTEREVQLNQVELSDSDDEDEDMPPAPQSQQDQDQEQDRPNTTPQLPPLNNTHGNLVNTTNTTNATVAVKQEEEVDVVMTDASTASNTVDMKKENSTGVEVEEEDEAEEVEAEETEENEHECVLCGGTQIYDEELGWLGQVGALCSVKTSQKYPDVASTTKITKNGTSSSHNYVMTSPNEASLRLCGHYLHEHCYYSHRKGIRPPNYGEYYNWHDEFPCPLCKSASNVFLECYPHKTGDLKFTSLETQQLCRQNETHALSLSITANTGSATHSEITFPFDAGSDYSSDYGSDSDSESDSEATSTTSNSTTSAAAALFEAALRR